MRAHPWMIIGMMVLAGGIGPGYAATATVKLAGTGDPSRIFGVVVAQEKDGGLRVQGNLANLPPGLHGFHIHENGSCGDGGKAAGGHFNPGKMPHGFMPKDGAAHAHPGDMGNLTADQDGKAAVDVFLPGVSLNEGAYAVKGKAVIVHEKADDFSQPTGNAGGRIGCGILQADGT